MKVNRKMRNLLKQMMTDQRDLLEPMPNAMIHVRLVPLMAKQYGYSAAELRKELENVETIHINSLRKALGWDPSPKGKNHPSLGKKIKGAAKREEESKRPEVVIDIPKTAKSLGDVSKESQPRFLMVSEEVHKILKQMMAFAKKAEKREEDLLDLEESLRQREEIVRQYQQTLVGQRKVANPAKVTGQQKAPVN